MDLEDYRDPYQTLDDPVNALLLVNWPLLLSTKQF